MSDNLNIFGTIYPNATGIKAYDENGTLQTFIKPSGTLSITQNGTSDCTNYASVNVSVSAPTPSYETQTKSYTPSETAQTETLTASTGYDAIEQVDITVGAISSTYVGSGITQRSSTDLSASGDTVSVPSGYYASNASKAVSSGSATTPATTITVNPSISVSSGGLITATASATQSVAPTVSAGYVSSGTAGTITVSGSNTSQMTTKGATTYTPTTSNQTIASGTYLTGTQTISGDANLVAGNIKSGTTIFGVTGSYTGGGSSKNVQVYSGYASRTANSYGATSVTLTVSKTGSYKITYMAWRGSSSGTMGTNLHIGSAAGTNQQTWTGTYGQCVTSIQSLTQGTVLTLYATSGSSSRTVYVGNLIIEEQ